jgi:hypothetical protein
MTAGHGPRVRAVADAAELTAADRVFDAGCGPAPPYGSRPGAPPPRPALALTPPCQGLQIINTLS